MMRALLDTNIVIHRENTRVTNSSIGQLFYWLDTLHYEKVIHPFTVSELRKYSSQTMQELYDAKLSAYKVMHTTSSPTDDFLKQLEELPKSENDNIDNQLLFEVYRNRVDVLITEDRKMIAKAIRIGIRDRVFTINGFITRAVEDNPALLEYKALSVKKEFFGDIDLEDSFFNTFREAYPNFDCWFNGKCDEEAYVCRSDQGCILGFLYLKTEGIEENYSDITPALSPAKRLKVGTFKVDATGFRLGERFIKIIFDNAIQRKVDEIYVTLFLNRPELRALKATLERWGFTEHGVKHHDSEDEIVLVKKLGVYSQDRSVLENFPNLCSKSQKWIMPIFPKYHTSLFPDAALYREKGIDLIGELPHRYALQKVYISWSIARGAKSGDLVLFYRTGDTSPKKYSSVITSVGVIDEIVYNFSDKDDFMRQCKNRSVFTEEDLIRFWQEHKANLQIIKFVYVKELEKKITLGFLWDNDIVDAPNGPRPFSAISDEQFETIIEESHTELYL